MEGGLRVVGMGYGRDTAMYQFSNAVDECLLDSPFLFSLLPNHSKTDG